MALAVATGYGRAVGTWSLNPEYSRLTNRMRAGAMSPVEGGFVERRQTALSGNEIDYNDQVREWELTWKRASKAEVDAFKTFRNVARGGGGLFYFKPPEETDPSNLCPSPENFRAVEWSRDTSDTVVNTDATALPAGVGGSAYLLSNAGGATVQAGIRAAAGRFPVSGMLTAFSCYIQQPAINASLWMTIGHFKPGDLSGGADKFHFATYFYNGAAWVTSTTSGDGVSLISTSGAWTRVLFTVIAGTGSPAVAQFPALRFVRIEVGTAAVPSAGLGVLIAGAMLDEAPTQATLTSLGSYHPTRTHSLARFSDDPQLIERWGPNQYRMRVRILEEPVAP